MTIFNVCQADEKLKHVRVPLMCLIDYRGFRVVAISVLPITRATLRYGSSDGGMCLVCAPFDAASQPQP